MSDTKAGNSFIFCLFTLLNMLLIVLGLGISAAAVYLWTLTKSANYFTLSFLGLGVFLAMIATCAFCMRRSTVRLSLYILILLIICIVQTTGTILLIVKRDQVVDWCMDHIDEKSQDAFQKAKEEMENNINITQYIIIATNILTILILIFAVFYKCSVSSRTSEAEEEKLHQGRYERMSKDIEAAHRKNEEKKKLYQDKYNINRNDMT